MSNMSLQVSQKSAYRELIITNLFFTYDPVLQRQNVAQIVKRFFLKPASLPGEHLVDFALHYPLLNKSNRIA